MRIILFLFSVSILVPQTENTSVSPDGLESDGATSISSITKDAVDVGDSLTEFQIALRLGNMEKAKELLFNAVKVNEENRKEFDRFNDINVKMNDGGRAMKSGQYEEAFSNYEVVVAEFPNFTEAVFSMGLAKFRLSDIESAVNYYSRALELNPDHEKARIAIDNVVKNTFNDGNNAYRRGNLEGAMDSYYKVLTFDSTFTRAHYQIGVIETKRGNLSIAIDAYSQAIEIDSTFYQGWFALGLAQNKYGNNSDALRCFQKAVEIDSTYAKAYSSMGDIYIKGRNYEMAIGVLNTAIAVQPNYSKPFISLGMIYMEMDSLEMAKFYLEKGTLLDPKNGGAWVRLASVHNQLKDCESAIIAAREATDRKKRFGAGWYELGIAEWCNGKGNKTAALNALEKAREDRSWRQMAEYEIDKIKNPAKYEE